METKHYKTPDFIKEALVALKPVGKQTVSQWADSNRILDSRTSALPGRWKTAFTPYLQKIMDSFNDPAVEEIVIVKPTQVGGTEAILNMIGYVVDVDPSPMMVVYPTEVLGESISLNRIQPMIELVPSLRKKYDSNSKRLELQFSGMYLAISGANSPSSLASRPCRYLFLDEVDKYPSNAGKEADPRSLARERTNTYKNDRKIVQVSTPTMENGAIWQAFQKADTQYNNFVTCPHCKEEFVFKFKQLKFDKESPDKARETAIYICEHCGATISDYEKSQMIKFGQWRAIKEGSRRNIAFHFNTFYSPWVRFSDIAYEFVSSYKHPTLLMNFINSWLAEPFKQVSGSISADGILKYNTRNYPMGQVHHKAVLLTGGVDVQKGCFYYTIRVWLNNMTSYNLCHGQVFTYAELEDVFNRQYFDRYQNPHIVNLCCVDTGYNTDEVYDFCAKNSHWCMPIKGSSVKMLSRYRMSRINKDGLANGMLLCVLDTESYKDTLNARMKRGEDEGGWYIYDGCDVDYIEMIASEHKVVEKVRGRLVERWVQKQTGRDNHYWDCEVYAAAAADLCGLRTIAAERFKPKEVKIVEESPPKVSSNNYFKSKKVF